MGEYNFVHMNTCYILLSKAFGQLGVWAALLRCTYAIYFTLYLYTLYLQVYGATLGCNSLIKICGNLLSLPPCFFPPLSLLSSSLPLSYLPPSLSPISFPPSPFFLPPSLSLPYFSREKNSKDWILRNITVYAHLRLCLSTSTVILNQHELLPLKPFA